MVPSRILAHASPGGTCNAEAASLAPKAPAGGSMTAPAATARAGQRPDRLSRRVSSVPAAIRQLRAHARRQDGAHAHGQRGQFPQHRIEMQHLLHVEQHSNVRTRSLSVTQRCQRHERVPTSPLHQQLLGQHGSDAIAPRVADQCADGDAGHRGVREAGPFHHDVRPEGGIRRSPCPRASLARARRWRSSSPRQSCRRRGWSGRNGLPALTGLA